MRRADDRGVRARQARSDVLLLHLRRAEEAAHLQKRNERKDELEASIVDYIGSCVLTDSWIDGAAERVVAEYQKSYDASGIKPLEKQIRDADKEIDQLVDALISATAEAARRRINERIETAEARKQALEADLASLRIASRVQIKKRTSSYGSTSSAPATDPIWNTAKSHRFIRKRDLSVR